MRDPVIFVNAEKRESGWSGVVMGIYDIEEGEFILAECDAIRPTFAEAEADARALAIAKGFTLA